MSLFPKVCSRVETIIPNSLFRNRILIKNKGLVGSLLRQLYKLKTSKQTSLKNAIKTNNKLVK